MTLDLDQLAGLDRLREIAAFDLFHPVLRERLDGLARHCAITLDQPIGMINVVLDTAQYIAGGYGVSGWALDARGIPVEWSMCAHTVLAGRAYVVGDAREHRDHRGNPLVRYEGLRSYAGVPVYATGQIALGSACVVGTRPREYTTDDLAVLEESARQASAVLNEFRLA